MGEGAGAELLIASDYMGEKEVKLFDFFDDVIPGWILTVLSYSSCFFHFSTIPLYQVLYTIIMTIQFSVKKTTF